MIIWLDYARIFAIYAVILLHVSAGLIGANDIGTENWWIGNIYDSAVRWAVPVLVMISGALLLDSNKQESLLVFYKKRASRILIPLITWSLIFLVWAAWQEHLTGREITITFFAKKILLGKPYYHMWFLYMLPWLYLFTPFIRKTVSCFGKGELILLTVVLFVLSALNHLYGKMFSVKSMLFINWFILYLPYFIAGYLIRKDKNNYSNLFLFFVLILSLIVTAGGCYIVALNYGLELGLYFYGSLSISVIPLAISIMYLIKKINIPIFGLKVTKKISFLSFGVYLIHPIILEIIKPLGLWNNLNAVVSVPLITSIVFLVSLLAVWGLSKIPYIRRII